MTTGSGGGAGAWVLRAVLAAVTIVVYWNSLDGAFVFDDRPWITERTSHFEAPLHQVIRGERRPLVTLSLALNYRLGGLEPAGFHLFNLAVHVISVLLLFELVRFGAVRARIGPAAAFAGLVALLWAVHPLGTESVTYTVQRAESMAACFCLLMLLAIARHEGAQRSWPWAAVAVLACALGMVSKPTMVAAPVLAFLFDGLVVSSSFAAAVRSRGGLHITLVACLAILVATGTIGGLFSNDGPPATVGFEVASVSAADYLASQPGVLLHYGRLFAWPSELCIDRAWPIESDTTRIATATAAMVVVAFVIVRLVIRRSPLAFPAAAALIWLLPTSSIVPLRDLAVEHRVYLPAAFAIVVVAGVVTALVRRSRGLSLAAAGLAMLVAGALAARTVDRNRDYATPVALWTSTLEVAPDNPRARDNLAAALVDAGRPQEAIELLASLVETHPNRAGSWLNYGSALLAVGRAEEAAAVLAPAIAAMPDRVDVRLLQVEAYRAANMHDAARSALERAHAALPEPLTSIALGNELVAAGEPARAAVLFAEAATLAAEQGETGLEASAWFNLGNLHLQAGEYEEAATAYRQALVADPDHDAARHWLGEAEKLGD